MRSSTVPSLRTLALIAALALSPWLAACSGDDRETSGEAPVPAGARVADGDSDAQSSTVRRYDVRGQVVRVPDPADPLSDLVIRHEAIPDFEGIDGEQVGMSSMAMPFPVAPAVSLEGIAPGDKIAFTLEVDWDSDPAYRVARLEKLPEGTELSFAGKEPSASSVPAAGGMIPPPEDYPVVEPPVV